MTRLAEDSVGRPAQTIRQGPTTTVSVGSGSQQSSALSTDAHTTIVLVTTDTDCHVVVGSNPTATTSDTPLWANAYLFLEVRRNEKIAVIQNSASGTLYITEGR